ncbi:MAG: ferritin-like domain-containing protein [Desulfobacteraceae bacterium]|nr:ferritin-like domain-containing protein [Desulfobacteraceae bacterium]
MTLGRDRSGIRQLSAPAFREYRNRERESDFLLVDVRQPGEYEAGHIAGAVLLPLPELENRLSELASDRELIFYCRSGSRSMAAATLASEAQISSAPIYNLRGGILAWEDRLLPDYPRVAVFGEGAGRQAWLRKAMALEKGALRFYQAGVERFTGQTLADRIAEMAEEETAHARMVYQFWKTQERQPPAFETLFDSLDDSVIEGGESVQAVLDRLEAFPEAPCLHFIELALQIEYASLDLYRHLAEGSEDETVTEAFLSLAQAEKGHMRSLIESLEQCQQ